MIKGFTKLDDAIVGIVPRSFMIIGGKMCNFISYCIDRQGFIYYSNLETRKEYDEEENHDSHSFINSINNVSDDECWKYELELSISQWKQALANYKQTREIPVFVLKNAKYDGGLPEEEQTSVQEQAERNFILKLFETNEIYNLLKMKFPSEFRTKLKISDIQHTAFVLYGEEIRRIVNSYPTKYVSKKFVDNMHKLKDDQAYSAVFYIKRFYHPQDGFQNELRVSAHPLSKFLESFDVEWDVENCK